MQQPATGSASGCTGPGRLSNTRSRRAGARRWPWALIGAALLLAMPAAQAASYTFPGKLPPGCSANSSGTFACSGLTLAAGDTLSITAPTTITVNGALKTGMASRINSGGKASQLTIVVSGTSNLGDNAILTANLNSGGAVTTGAGSNVVGNITTVAGVINIGAHGTVVGALKTDSAAINTGDFSSITGAITSTIAGVVTIGADASVVGNITTSSGAINVGARSRIDGTITSLIAGAITLGANAMITGSVATTYQGSDVGAGAITLEDDVQVQGAVTTHTGAITTGTRSKVSGSIASNDGAITVGDDADVGGAVCTGNSGAITVGDVSNVGGNIETALAGAITVGNLSHVRGAVTVRGAGARTVATDATTGSMIGSTCGAASVKPGPPIPLKIKSRQWRQLFMR